MQRHTAQISISKARQALMHLEDIAHASSFLITRRSKPFARLELLGNKERLFQKTLEMIEALPPAKSRKRRIAASYKGYLGR